MYLKYFEYVVLVLYQHDHYLTIIFVLFYKQSTRYTLYFVVLQKYFLCPPKVLFKSCFVLQKYF